MSEHSIVPPSSMHRLVNCTGSFALSILFPQSEDTPDAMEGTAAHWVCSELVSGRQVPEGTLAPNGIAVTNEMIEGAEMWVNLIPTRMLLPAMPIYIEEPVMIPRIHAQCWGTPDLWYQMDGAVNVLDYKFGHEYVDVYENWQLISYACGIFDQLGWKDDQHCRVNFTIVQPRCFHREGPVRSWSVLMSDLRGHINRLKMAVDIALDHPDQAKCVTGDWCRHCPGAHACDALQKSTQSVLQFVSKPVPTVMSPHDKGLFLWRVQQAMTLLKSIEEGLEEDVTNSIRRGVAVPGYELVPGQGRVRWIKPFEEVVALGDVLGVNLRKNALLTPKQAESEFKKKGIDGSVINVYSESSNGALKLERRDNTLTRRVFGTLKE